MKANKYIQRTSIVPLSFILAVIIILMMPAILLGQNVGIGTDSPAEKLQVQGKVYSADGGFKFPDGSVQTRASNAYETQDAAEGRWIIILENANLPGSFTFLAYANMIKVIDFDWGYFHNATEVMPITDPCHFKLLTIYKEIDKSTPLFPQFWTNYTDIGQTIFHFFKYDTAIQNYAEYFKLTFIHTRIVKHDINLTFIGNNQYAHTEKVVMTWDGHVLFYWFGPPVVQNQLEPIDCGR